MKILQVISSLNPEGGGPIEVLKQLSTMLYSLDDSVEIACLDSPDASWCQDLQILPLPIYALGPSLGKYRWSAQFVPWLKEHVQQYDAVIVHGIWQYSSFGVWQALRQLKNRGQRTPPYFVFTHGMLDPWFQRAYPFKHLKKILYWPWAEYRVLRDAQAVLFTCEEERRLARQSFWPYRCQENVLNYGIIAPQFIPERCRDLFWACYPGLRGQQIILFLGRIHPKKGCDLLIQAFAAVLQKHTALHLVMAGPDQIGWQAELQSTAQMLNVSEKITWTGMLQGDLKWGAFCAADVFVLPSHQENFGIGVAEALACGLPVLISNQVNIWREIEMGGAGFVAPDTLAGTTALLSQWCALSAPEKELMRQNARQCFTQQFELNQFAQSFYGIISTPYDQ
jgi:glycosyltransferase involved in cell wall biosynthesis